MPRTDLFILPLAGALFLSPAALSQQTDEPTPISLSDAGVVGSRVTLQLIAGDQLTGRLISVADGVVTIMHRDLGEISVPRSRVARAVRPVFVNGIERAPVNPEAVPPPAPAPEATPADDAPEVPAPEPDVVWEREFEMGLRGSSGNTDRLNFDAGLSLKREDKAGTFSFDASYYYAQDDGEDTANRLDLNVRNDWNLDDPRWFIFAQGSYEYDEFRDFDYRVAGGAGIGHKVIEEEDTTLTLRVGVGASREFGDNANEDVKPELILGAEFTHDFNESNRFVATADLFPDLSDLGEFRSISTAAWEIDIDKGKGLTFRVGAEHRYLSEVEDAEKSDLDYFARVVYSF